MPDVPTFGTLADLAAAVGPDARPAPLDGADARPFEALHPEPTASGPFRTAYFTVVLVRAGRGRYALDGTEYPTRPGTVYFTNPGHVKAFAVEEPVTGWVVTFTEAFLKAHARPDVFDDLPFLLAESAPPFYADDAPGGPAAFAALDALAAQVNAEARRPSSVRPRLVAALLTALLLRFRAAFWDGYDPAEEGSALVGAFRRELEARVRALVAGDAPGPPSLSDLAGALALHPTYLATVVKAKTGRTVGAHTAEKLAAEARALLALPRASVKETAYRLGFSEPTAFSRFFKRETGRTPTAFRRAARRGR